MNADIVIVSGLPRSGTSLMMQLLEAGGVEVVTDGQRVADADNPRGYHEYERVKKIKDDVAWLPEIRGKAVKMVSQLLYDLPSDRVVSHHLHAAAISTKCWIHRKKMLARSGNPRRPAAKSFARSGCT